MAENVYGGLGDLDDEGKQPIVYDVYQQQSQTPGIDLSNLQNVYGTAAMPVFQWVNTIKTGERSYTPGDSFDEEMLEKYNELLSESEKQELGLPSTREIVVGLASPILQQVGQQAVSAIYDPYLTGGTLGKMGQGVASTFGELPGQEVSSLISDFDTSSLKKGEVFLPELSSSDVAKRTGMTDTFLDLDNQNKGIFPETQVADVAGPKVDRAGNVTGRRADVSGAVPAARPDTYFGGVADRLTSQQVCPGWNGWCCWFRHQSRCWYEAQRGCEVGWCFCYWCLYWSGFDPYPRPRGNNWWHSWSVHRWQGHLQ